MKDIKIVIKAVKGPIKSLHNITIYVQDNQITVAAFRHYPLDQYYRE